jgi:RimJ/RimL family protein N-acetyltransferase
LDAGRQMLGMTFDQYNIDYLFGTTPAVNKAALAYAKRLGFEMYGPIPNSCAFRGKIESTYISHITKDLLNERRTKKED